MDTTNWVNRNKHYLWLAGCLMIFVSVLTGAGIGGFAGYLLADEMVTQAQPAPVQLGSNPVAVNPEPITVASPVTSGAGQTLPITEESASVEAVGKVLPAVVTVLNQGLRGGGSGSGFIIGEDGYIVTNNHVVEGAQQLIVIYAQGGAVPAALVGTTPEFDLAVLKVDGPVPAVAAWGDSGELPLGAGVIAIGSALGEYQNTVTAGILSGFNRELGGLRALLQTDAAINQGNSGGPLINLAGQVIGINTMTVRGGFTQAEGLGFAIPSNIARSVVRQLIETGEAKPSFMGIQYQELNPQLASQENLPVTQGALLQEVVANAPAGRAGLQVGDVITAINGQPVDDRHPLVSLLLEHVAGETISLKILRDGKTMDVNLTLGQRA